MAIEGVGGVAGAGGASAQEQQLVNNVVEDFAATQFTWLFNQLMQTTGQYQQAMQDNDPNNDS